MLRPGKSKFLSKSKIVLGTHGYGMLKDTLMGGTVRRVLRCSKTPVLVVRNPEAVEA
jgi:nucleotide-binding universal stress UspA family protein